MSSAARVALVLIAGCASTFVLLSSSPAHAQRRRGGGSSSSSSSSDPADLGALAPEVAAASAARGPRHFEDLTGDLPGEAITAVAVDPDDDQVIYAGTDGFLWKTDDGGESWRPILSFPQGIADEENDTELPLEPLAPEGSAASSADGIAAPTTIGDTTSPAAGSGADEELPDGSADEVVDTTAFARAGPGVRAISFVPGSSSVFYVATPHGLYRTTSKGSSFERLGSELGPAENDVRDVVVDPSKPSRIYLATARGVVMSRDGGNTFIDAHGRAGSVGALCAAIGPDGTFLLVGTEEGLLRSFDNGGSFLEVLLRGLPPQFPVSAVAISQKSGTFYAGTSQGLFVGERGAALLEQYDGVATVLVDSLSPDPILPRGVAVGTRSRGLLLSWNAGVNVDENAEHVPAAEVFSIARGMKKRDDIVVATDRGVFRSVPGSGVTISSSALKKLRQMWAAEPSLDDTARQALHYNRIDPELASSMEARAAVSHLLPRMALRFQYKKVTGEGRDEFALVTSDEIDPTTTDQTDIFGNVVGAFNIIPSDATTYVGVVLFTWDLDSLILNPAEVAVGNQGPQWWAAEKRILDRVREVFTSRRRLMTEMALGDVSARGERAAKAEAARQLRFEELTAELDAVTGGAFSESQSSHRLDGGDE